MPDPSSFERGRMEGQAESVRGRMGDSRRDEQPRDAERAKRAAEGKADSFLARIRR